MLQWSNQKLAVCKSGPGKKVVRGAKQEGSCTRERERGTLQRGVQERHKRGTKKYKRCTLYKRCKIEVQRGTTEVRQRYNRGTTEVQQRYNRGTRKAQERYKEVQEMYIVQEM